MGVETKIPDESSPGVKYPRYDELGPEWRGQDRVFVNRELFDKMAAGRSGFDVRSFILRTTSPLIIMSVINCGHLICRNFSFVIFLDNYQ